MIQLSESATDEVRRLKAKHKNPNLLFRLGIQSTGCLGLSYELGFEETVRESDRIYATNGIQIVVEESNLPLLDGLVVDYSEDLMGGSFRFHNPNAVQNCGCGHSFTV